MGTVVPRAGRGVRASRGRQMGDCCICALPEIQSKRQERKRRSTAKPAYSGLLETEVRPAVVHRDQGWAPSLSPGVAVRGMTIKNVFLHLLRSESLRPSDVGGDGVGGVP